MNRRQKKKQEKYRILCDAYNSCCRTTYRELRVSARECHELEAKTFRHRERNRKTKTISVLISFKSGRI